MMLFPLMQSQLSLLCRIRTGGAKRWAPAIDGGTVMCSKHFLHFVTFTRRLGTV